MIKTIVSGAAGRMGQRIISAICIRKLLKDSHYDTLRLHITEVSCE